MPSTIQYVLSLGAVLLLPNLSSPAPSPQPAVFHKGIFNDPHTGHDFELLSLNEHETPAEAFAQWNDSINAAHTPAMIGPRASRDSVEDPEDYWHKKFPNGMNVYPDAMPVEHGTEKYAVSDRSDIGSWDQNLEMVGDMWKAAGDWKSCRRWKDDLYFGCHTQHGPWRFLNRVGVSKAMNMYLLMSTKAWVDDEIYVNNYRDTLEPAWTRWGPQRRADMEPRSMCVMKDNTRLCLSWNRPANSTLDWRDIDILLEMAMGCFDQRFSAQATARFQNGLDVNLCFSDRPNNCRRGMCWRTHVNEDHVGEKISHPTGLGRMRWYNKNDSLDIKDMFEIKDSAGIKAPVPIEVKFDEVPWHGTPPSPPKGKVTPHPSSSPHPKVQNETGSALPPMEIRTCGPW